MRPLARGKDWRQGHVKITIATATRNFTTDQWRRIIPISMNAQRLRALWRNLETRKVANATAGQREELAPGTCADNNTQSKHLTRGLEKSRGL
jgi:hypothetical protein